MDSMIRDLALCMAAALYELNPVQFGLAVCAIAECAENSLGQDAAINLCVTVWRELGERPADFASEPTDDDFLAVRHALANAGVDLANDKLQLSVN